MLPDGRGSVPTCPSATGWSRRSSGPPRSARPRSRSSATTRPRGGAGPSRRRSSRRSGRASRADIGPVAIHAAYLVNLAGADADFFERSVEVLAAELRQRAGVRRAVRQRPHRLAPRRRAGRGDERLAEGVIRAARDRPSGPPRRPAADSSARELGGRWLTRWGRRRGAGRRSPRRIARDAACPATRVGFCLDTAHAWGAGYASPIPTRSTRSSSGSTR